MVSGQTTRVRKERSKANLSLHTCVCLCPASFQKSTMPSMKSECGQGDAAVEYTLFLSVVCYVITASSAGSSYRSRPLVRPSLRSQSAPCTVSWLVPRTCLGGSFKCLVGIQQSCRLEGEVHHSSRFEFQRIPALLLLQGARRGPPGQGGAFEEAASGKAHRREKSAALIDFNWEEEPPAAPSPTTADPFGAPPAADASTAGWATFGDAPAFEVAGPSGKWRSPTRDWRRHRNLVAESCFWPVMVHLQG
jgi:hypothetical protein